MSQYVSSYSPSLWVKSGSKQEKLSYRDYLQAQNFVKEITDSTAKVQYGVSKSSREIIATLDQLKDSQFEIVGAVQEIAHSVQAASEIMTQGFNVIAYQLEGISEGIVDLNATCHWGFTQMIADIGQVNNSLKELISINKNPVQTRAYNQFEIARDALRRGHYADAVEALGHAINGYGGEPGYKLEYRFHYTLGLLYLGDAKNTDPGVLDLAKAENAFLAAARYARTDFPREASVAFTAASWAAFCQGRLQEAESHAELAIRIYPELSETKFQLAKVLMCRDEPEKALAYLKRAIEMDRNYMLKAAADLDFLKYEPRIQSLFDECRIEAREHAQKLLGDSELQIKEALEWMDKPCIDLKAAVSFQTDASREASTNTYFGYLRAADLARKSANLALSAITSRRTDFKSSYLDKLNHFVDLRREIQLIPAVTPSFFSEVVADLDEVISEKESMNSRTEYRATLARMSAIEDEIRVAKIANTKQTDAMASRSEAIGNISGGIVGAGVGIFGGTVLGLILGIPTFIILGASGPGFFIAFFIGLACGMIRVWVTLGEKLGRKAA